MKKIKLVEIYDVEDLKDGMRVILDSASESGIVAGTVRMGMSETCKGDIFGVPTKYSIFYDFMTEEGHTWYGDVTQDDIDHEIRIYEIVEV
ncbi:MAG: hypothetical protein ACRCTZ_03805 [Sarcina sp.]